jgi:hypothetical protein
MTLKMQFAISGPSCEIHNVRQSNVRDEEVLISAWKSWFSVLGQSSVALPYEAKKL